MATLSAVTLRLPLIQGSRDKIVDKLSGKVPAIPRGNGVNLQCAAFSADPQESSLVTNLADFASITMQVRNTNALGTAIFDKTVAAVDFTTGLTWAAWDANTGQHFTIPLTAAETGQAMPSGKAELPIYIAFEAIPLVGDPVFLGSITTVIFEDGIGSSGSPVVGDPTYLTAAESRAEFARKLFATADITNGAEFVDVDIFSLGLAAAPTHVLATIQPPADGSDALLIQHARVIDADTVRVRFTAAATASGYKVTLLVG